MVFKQKVLFKGESTFGRYKVVDMSYNGRPARVLFGNRATPQSGVAKDNEPDLLFHYNQRFLEMMMSKRPKRVLVIGGGAFMLPIAAFNQFPDLSIDVVEIDPLLVDISKDFFDLPDDTRLSIHIGDGAEFVRTTKKRYDMIIIDAFSGFTIPHHLIESSTIQAYEKRLKRHGVIAINFISEYKSGQFKLAHELIDTFSQTFSHISLYQADAAYPKGEDQNLLLVASHAATHFDYLYSQELERQ